MSASPKSKRIPSYRLHSPSGQAVVTIHGRDHYLGPYGSPESRAEYDRRVAEWLASGRLRVASADPRPGTSLSVVELILAYMAHAETYYRRPDGSLSPEVDDIKAAMRPLKRLYGATLAAEFGPLALRAYRDGVIRAGLARPTVNAYVSRIRRLFKWAVANELVPPSVHHALSAVDGLRRGRSIAPEPAPIRPVAEDVVEATLPFLAPPVVAMVRLQLLTGMRPGEVTAMRTRDLDRTGAVWSYRPEHHKTAHHGIARTIFLGPKAQEILRPALKVDPDAFLFSPAEAMEWRSEERRRARKSPMTPSQAARRPKASPDRAPGERYTTSSYGRAIAYAATKAGVEQWGPNRLRHTAATRLRREYGLDAAKAILGHRLVETTQVYAEIDAAKAAEIMALVG